MPKFESEDKLIRFLNKIDQEAQGARGDIDRRMKEGIDIFRGKQWKGNSSPYFLYNIVESAIEEKVGKLSETKPRMKVMPVRNGLGDAAEVLSKAVQGVWDRRKMTFKTERIALFAALSGAAFVGTPYNRNLQNGAGDIDIVVKDPRACSLDVAISNAEDGDLGEYFIAEDFLPIDVIRAQYPQRGGEVKPDERVVATGSSGAPINTRDMLRNIYDRLKRKEEAQRARAIPSAILREYYIKDRRRDIEEPGLVPIVQRLTKFVEEGQPFPGGRRIIRAGDVILEDTWNPYWDGNPPIDMMSWKIDLESAWAADEVQGVKRMAEGQNRLGDAYTKTAILNGVVRVIMDSGALSPEERNKLSNEVSQIIVKNPGRELQYMVPEMLPDSVLVFIDKLHDWIRRKIGVTEAPTQKRVPSIITGPAVEGLQLMIETPIRTAARRVEEFYQRVGQKLISRVFQYYTADRLIQMVGPSQEWMSFEFERRRILVGPDGQMRNPNDIRKAFQDFYFAIEPGSSLAITKTQRVAAKFALVQAGLLHPREILVEAGFENPDEKLAQAQEAKGQGLFDVITGGRNGSSANIDGLFSDGAIQ